MTDKPLTPKISSIKWREITTEELLAQPNYGVINNERSTSTSTDNDNAESWWPAIIVFFFALLFLNRELLWRRLRPDAFNAYWLVYIRPFLRRCYARTRARVAPRVSEALFWIGAVYTTVSVVFIVIYEALGILRSFLVSIYEAGPRSIAHLLEISRPPKTKRRNRSTHTATQKPKQHLKFTEAKNWHYAASSPSPSRRTEAAPRALLYNATNPSPATRVVTLTEGTASLQARLEDKEWCNRKLRGDVARTEKNNERLWKERKSADEQYARERKDHAATRSEVAQLDMKLKKSALVLKKEKRENQDLKSELQLAALLKAECPDLDDEPLFSLDPEMDKGELLETFKKHLDAQRKETNRRWRAKFGKASKRFDEAVAGYEAKIENQKALTRVQAKAYDTEIERLNDKIKRFKDDVPTALETYRQLTLEKHINVPSLQERLENLKIRYGLARQETARVHKRSLAISEHLQREQAKAGKDQCCHIAGLKLELEASEKLDEERRLRMDDRTELEGKLAKAKAERVWLAVVTGHNIEGMEEQWETFTEIIQALVDAEVDGPEEAIEILKNHAAMTWKVQRLEIDLESDCKRHKEDQAKMKALVNDTSIQAQKERFDAKKLLEEERASAQKDLNSQRAHFERLLEHEREDSKDKLERERAQAQLDRNIMQEDLDKAREERNSTDAQLVECQANLALAQKQLSAGQVPISGGVDNNPEPKHSNHGNDAGTITVINPFSTSTSTTAACNPFDTTSLKPTDPAANPFAAANTSNAHALNNTDSGTCFDADMLDTFDTTASFGNFDTIVDCSGSNHTFHQSNPNNFSGLSDDTRAAAAHYDAMTTEQMEIEFYTALNSIPDDPSHPQAQEQGGLPSEFAVQVQDLSAQVKNFAARTQHHTNAPQAQGQSFTVQWPAVQAQDRAIKAQNQTFQPWKTFQPQDLNPLLQTPQQAAQDQEHQMPDAEKLTADEEELLEVFDMGGDDTTPQPPTTLKYEFQPQVAAVEAQDQTMGGVTEDFVADAKLEQELQDEFGSPPHSPGQLPSPPNSSPPTATKADKENKTSDDLLKEVGQEMRMSKTITRQRGIRAEPTKAQRRAAPWMMPVRHDL